MSAECLPFAVAQDDVRMDKRFSIAHTDIAGEADDFHSIGKFQVDIFALVLIVVCDLCLRYRADSLDAPDEYILTLDDFCHFFIQIGATCQLSDNCTSGFIRAHVDRKYL